MLHSFHINIILKKYDILKKKSVHFSLKTHYQQNRKQRLCPFDQKYKETSNNKNKPADSQYLYRSKDTIENRCILPYTRKKGGVSSGL